MGGRSETKERRNSRPCLAHVRAFPLPGATHNTRRPLPPSTPLPPLRVGSLKRVLLAVCFTCFTCFICFACSIQTWAKRNADDHEGRYGVTSHRKPLRTRRGGGWVVRGGDACVAPGGGKALTHGTGTRATQASPPLRVCHSFLVSPVHFPFT